MDEKRAFGSRNRGKRMGGDDYGQWQAKRRRKQALVYLLLRTPWG